MNSVSLKLMAVTRGYVLYGRYLGSPLVCTVPFLVPRGYVDRMHHLRPAQVLCSMKLNHISCGIKDRGEWFDVFAALGNTSRVDRKVVFLRNTFGTL